MDTLNQYAKEHDVPILQEAGFEFVLKTIKEEGCQSFLELGTAIAKTSIAVAQIHPDMKVVTIERDQTMIEQAKQNISKAGVGNQITLIEADALEAEVEGVFDCIFIDAAKAQYRRFFEKYCPHLSANGIIISDNMNFHGLVAHPERTNNRNTRQLVRKLKQYGDYLSQLDEFQTTFYDIGDGIAVTRRKV